MVREQGVRGERERRTSSPNAPGRTRRTSAPGVDPLRVMMHEDCPPGGLRDRSSSPSRYPLSPHSPSTLTPLRKTSLGRVGTPGALRSSSPSPLPRIKSSNGMLNLGPTANGEKPRRQTLVHMNILDRTDTYQKQRRQTLVDMNSQDRTGSRFASSVDRPTSVSPAQQNIVDMNSRDRNAGRSGSPMDRTSRWLESK